MNTLLLALTVIASTQEAGLNAKIDEFSSTAESVEAVVNRLASLSKEVLIVTGPVSREPIFINIHDTTVQGVMDRVASATYGSWKAENGAYTLIQGTEAAAASARERQKRIERVRETINKRLAELKKKSWGPSSAEEVVKNIDQLRDKYRNSFRVPDGSRPRVNISGIPAVGPVDYVLGSCLEVLSPEQIADLEDGQRVVLSTRANRMQQGVRGNLSAAMSLYSRANAEVFDAAKGAMVRDFEADWEGSLGLPKQREVSVAKLNIVLLRDGEQVGVELQIVGVNGEELGTKAISIPLGKELEAEELNADSTQPPPDIQGDRIDLSPVSREFVNLRGNSESRRSMSMAMHTEDGLILVDAGQAPSAIRPSVELAEFFNQPGQRDFQGLVFPESLNEVEKDSDYVAILPDHLWAQVVSRFQGDSIPADRFRSLLDLATERVDVDGVAVIRPLDPLLTQQKRIDRSAMQVLTDKVHQVKFGHVKDIAEYVMSRGSAVGYLDCDSILFAISLPFVNPILIDFPKMTPALAQFLYNAPNLVTEVPTGKSTWLLSQMNRPMQAAMQQMVYSRKITNLGNGMSIGVSISDEEPRVPMIQDREPTEQFPNGLPGNLAVDVTVSEQAGVLGRLKGHPTGKLMTAVELGALTGFIEGSGGANSDMKISEFEEYFLANTRSIEVSYPGALGQGVYTDGNLLPGSRPLTITQLPAEILAKGAAARDMLRKAAQEMRDQQRADPPNW